MTPPVLVLGGGIAGLAAAERLVARCGKDSVRLIEAEPRLGGKIRTEHRDGFVLERGPDCFLAAKPGGVGLCRHLGIDTRLVPANPALRRSFIKRNGRLHPIPDGLSGLVPSRLPPLLTTPILSLPGRLRAGLEILVPRRRQGSPPESVAAFARRRFGHEAWAHLIEPLLGGIFAGDGDRLSLTATFPHLAAMESSHGSLLRPMLAARFRSPPTRAAVAGFVTLPGGLGELVEHLARRLPPPVVRLGVQALRVDRTSRGTFAVPLSDGSTIEAVAVVAATPAFITSRMLADLDPILAHQLEGIPFVSTATVSLAFRAADVPEILPGYGYVSPRVEGGRVIACTWTSNKFPDRAPPGHVLTRAVLGRAGQEEHCHQSDDTLVTWVRDELASVHRITAPPLLAEVTRWPAGMPQYTLDHESRMHRITGHLARWPGIALAGASYRGVGIPDCIRSGWEAADQTLGYLGMS